MVIFHSYVKLPEGILTGGIPRNRWMLLPVSSSHAPGARAAVGHQSLLGSSCQHLRDATAGDPMKTSSIYHL